jgi:hypothetical protein
VWDNLLDLHLFPGTVPLDNRRTLSKFDWEVWTATLGNATQSADLLIDCSQSEED